MSKTTSTVLDEILDAISKNVTEAADTDYPDSGVQHSIIAKNLAETYRLLEGS